MDHARRAVQPGENEILLPESDHVTPPLDAWRHYAEQRRAGTLTPPSTPARA